MKHLKEESKKQQEREGRKERLEQITKLLSSCTYKSEIEKQEAILSFAKATALSLADINKLVEPLRPDYYRSDSVQLKNNRSQVDKQGVF